MKPKERATVTIGGWSPQNAAAEERLTKIWDVAMNSCLKCGAVISHHHRVGLARLPYICQELGTSKLVLQRIKGTFDPAGVLNPGKFGLSQMQ